MAEAKKLGIPLSLTSVRHNSSCKPPSSSQAAVSQRRSGCPPSSAATAAPRSSVARLVDDSGHVTVSLAGTERRRRRRGDVIGDTENGVCRCACKSSGTGGRATGQAAASPLREKFCLQNLFAWRYVCIVVVRLRLICCSAPNLNYVDCCRKPSYLIVTSIKEFGS